MINTMSKEKLFEYVKTTTSVAQAAGMVERANASKSVSEKTKVTYEKTGARRLCLDENSLGKLMDGVTGQSWHATRAALLYVACDRYVKARKACDIAQKNDDLPGAVKEAMIARRAVVAFQKIQKAQRPEPTKKRATKRKTLPKADNWQRIVFEAATPAQKASIAIMWASGCRPVEVEKGVGVNIIDHNGRPLIEIKIRGAKVTESSGQSMRVIYVEPGSDSGRAVMEAMSGKDAMLIRRKAKRLNADFADIRSKTGFKVSPYSLRHQLSANLKAEAGPNEAIEIAKVMGHLTTRSQGRYGSVKQAQSGQTGVKGAFVTRDVKETRPARSIPSRTSRFRGPAPTF